MDETGQEVRPSSGDSESGSEGFVQVTQEDARLASQGAEEHQLEEEETRIPSVDDDADLYGGPEDGEEEGEEEQEGEPAHKEEEKEEEAEPDLVRRPHPMYMYVCMRARFAAFPNVEKGCSVGG